jgi:hypothetical protein
VHRVNRRTLLALCPGVAFAAWPRASRAADLPADAIFSAAKNVWRSRVEAPFVTFNLRERYVWREKTHDNWWAVSYRDRDRALALRRAIVPEEEADRLRGSAIAVNFRWHNGFGRADSLDTNADADAFPVLDPHIDPNASFGLLRHDQTAALVGADATFAGATQSQPQVPAASATVAPDPASSPSGDELREIASVEAVSRDYSIALAGMETVRDVDAFHLSLTPMRAPTLNRLRDLWVDSTTYDTLRLAMRGLFRGKPYEDARWVVTYVKMDGRSYVQQIRTDDTLRFGLDRFVTGLQYDFVGYAFPTSISPLTFERLL